MNTLLVGNKSAFRNVLESKLKSNGFAVSPTEDRTNPPLGNYDICVDLSARSIGDVKHISSYCSASNVHYIFLSTCQIYPPTERSSPWHPEEINLCDDTGFKAVPDLIRRFRAAERELFHQGDRFMPWTILRPSLVATKQTRDKENIMWWFVSRILDGGPIVLPDDDDPFIRHVSAEDLARAVMVIAGKNEALYQAIHVTSPALMSFESYARLIMQSLNKKVPMVRVDGRRWRNAQLRLPLGEYLKTSFIEDSLLLKQLGWQHQDEEQWVKEYAGYRVDHPFGEPLQRKTELALAELPKEDIHEPLIFTEPENWKLVGIPGAPISLHLNCLTAEESCGEPLLRTRMLGMGLAEEIFFVEPASNKTPRIVGHNSVLELIRPGDSRKGQRRSLFLPVAKRPCGEVPCSYCQEHEPGTAGITEDGYGGKYVSVPRTHLVEVPEDMGSIALLADSLACLLSVFSPLLIDNSGPVWIFGERVEALLAILLADESEIPVLHINRTKIDTAIPVVQKSMLLDKARKQIKDTTLERPTIVVNLSGAKDGENLLVQSLAQEGYFVSPFTVTQPGRHRVNIRLPVVAPGRLWLERAVEQLGKWSSIYNFSSVLQPVTLDCYHDLFASSRFKQPYLDMPGVR